MVYVLAVVVFSSHAYFPKEISSIFQGQHWCFKVLDSRNFMGNVLATSKIKIEASFEGNFHVITAIQYILNGTLG